MRSEILSQKFSDIHWRIQDSTEDSLLFYRIPDQEKGLELFFERLKGAKFHRLVINRHVDPLPRNCIVVPESDWAELQKAVLDQLYPLPRMKYMAITGTNGKTTTTDLVLQLGEMVGKKGLSIGTLGVREKNKTLLDFGLTSPPYIDLRKYLHKFGQDKDFCVMEASSHALVQDRLHGLSFDGAGWLSFSQDHLDYHQTMEAYFDAKCLLYKQLKQDSKIFVPSEQKSLFQDLLKVSRATAKAPVIESELPLFFRTRFNKDNLEVAKAIVEDVFKVTVPSHFDQLIPPDGRFYIRPYKTNYIVVDFAHTPDALENICRGIKEAFPQHKLKVLFGCGGDRDRTKRPKMASTVEKWADEILVTSDNPRTEDPRQIIDDIVKGIHHKKFEIEVDRPKAVRRAFENLRDKEVLLLAGKGHEDYILINGVKHPYSDIREVDHFLARKEA